ncbi:MAG: SLBB domain-containing protein [Candidatus Delongbacteria bacterium]|nr:SLBB domain-containing protein [Candidatus Delongbacteria bacterium]MBN2833385.1 SLBB domain-containing protein [Candidatus Delongbacteria bacterium]
MCKLKFFVLAFFIITIPALCQNLDEMRALYKTYTGKDLDINSIKSGDKSKSNDVIYKLDTLSTAEKKEMEKKIAKNNSLNKEKINAFEAYYNGKIIDPYADVLKLFSINFANVKINSTVSKLIPESYIPAVGDIFTIAIWGTINRTITCEITPGQYIILDDLGKIDLAGYDYAQSKKAIGDYLSKISGIEFDVRLSNVNPVHVFVFGQVEKPGAYMVSPFSSIIEILALSGGINQNGSYRKISVSDPAGKATNIDLYESFFHGDHKDYFFNSGSVIFVGNSESKVGIAGNVINSGIYEIKNGDKLDDILKICGTTPFSELNRIEIERIGKDGKRVIVNSNLKENPTLSNGDFIRIFSTLVYDGSYVFLKGNFKHPRQIRFEEGLTLLDIFTTEEVLKDNTNTKYAHIKRKASRGLQEKILNFSPEKIFDKSVDFDIALMNRDTIEVFSLDSLNFLDKVSIGGEVRISGNYMWNKDMPVNSLIAYAGGVTPMGDLKNVTVLRKNSESGFQYFSKIDPVEFSLMPGDSVHIGNFINYSFIEEVSLIGEVQREGDYAWFDGLTAKDLIGLSGGYTIGARTDSVMVVRKDGDKNMETMISIDDNYPILANDAILVQKNPERRKTKIVKMYGEVKKPGVYVVNSNDNIYDLLDKCGGLTENANKKGLRLFRKSVKEQQIEKYTKVRDELISRLKVISMMKEDLNALNSIHMMAFDSIPATGRVTIPFEDDHYLPIKFEDSDSVYVPEIASSVLVMGEVLFETSVAFNKDNPNVEYYLDKVGGVTDFANTSMIHIIKANGEVVKDDHLFSSIYYFDLEPGDMIYVPYDYSKVTTLQITKDITTILYQIGVATASMINATTN